MISFFIIKKRGRFHTQLSRSGIKHSDAPYIFHMILFHCNCTALRYVIHQCSTVCSFCPGRSQTSLAVRFGSYDYRLTTDDVQHRYVISDNMIKSITCAQLIATMYALYFLSDSSFLTADSGTFAHLIDTLSNSGTGVVNPNGYFISLFIEMRLVLTFQRALRDLPLNTPVHNFS